VQQQEYDYYIDLAKPKSGAPFCWQLLICENTLLQVVKLKKKKQRKKKKKTLLPLSVESGSSA